MTSGTPPRMAAWLESAWLARYLERQLDGEELAWFEAYLLDKPELLGMVEADNALREALAEVPRQERGARARDATQGRPATAARDRGFWMALAASLVIGVGAGWFAPHGGALSADDVFANPARVVYDTMRGAPTEPQVEPGDGHSPWLLVEVAVPPDALDITLAIAGKQDQRLHPTADGFVDFLLPRAGIGAATVIVAYRQAGIRVERKVDLNATMERMR